MGKNIVLTAACILLIGVGCTRMVLDPMPRDRKTFDCFTVSVENPGRATGTKLHLEEDGSLKWSGSDMIYVFSDEQGPELYYRTDDGCFRGEPVTGHVFYAYLRSNPYISYDPEHPASLKYVYGKFAWGNQITSILPMVAKGDDNNLVFRQTCGLIHFRFRGDVKLKSVLFHPNGMPASGEGEIDLTAETPLLTVTEPYDSGGWIMADDQNSGKWDLYFPYPESVFKEGFELTVRFEDPATGKSHDFRKRSHKDFLVERGVINNFPEIDLDEALAHSEALFNIEREALTTFYHAMGGDGWTDHTGWCSEKPLSEWHGVTLDSEGHVFILDLRDNKLQGEIPPEIGDLERLRDLHLSGEGITGQIPPSLVMLPDLQVLDINNTSISGTIPEELANAHSLYWLTLTNNPKLGGTIPPFLGSMKALRFVSLSNCNFTGNLPAEITALTELFSFECFSNPLSGKVPAAFSSWNLWDTDWGLMVYDTQLDISDAMPHCPQFEVAATDGTILTSDMLKDNRLTLLFSWNLHDKVSPQLIPYVVSAYNLFHAEGLEIVGYSSMEDVEVAAKRWGMGWHNFIWDTDHNFGRKLNLNYPGSGGTAQICAFDNSGLMVYTNLFDVRDFQSFITFMAEWFDSDWTGQFVGDVYESTDFSADGQVTVLQKATEGAGIDIVLMGDAYSDRLIADGTYERVLRQAMEDFFSVEPFKSLRNMFNVTMVTAVSRNESYFMGAEAETALSGWHSGFDLGGDDNKVMEYVHLAVGKDKDNDVVPIVIMNYFGDGGVCSLYGVPQGYTGDWGSGLGIAYFDSGSDSHTICHEAGGHGFAKLDDEYYSGEAALTDEGREYYKAYAKYGWWKNVDYVNDPSTVRWARFLADERYADEDLGIYEGAGGNYRYGLYRPSQESLMNRSFLFNAPSREAIWYRAHKLAYGAEWEYDYEEFVAWDLAHRSTSSNVTAKSVYVEKAPRVFTPSVIHPLSWEESRQR